jgi:hypothetical protein
MAGLEITVGLEQTSACGAGSDTDMMGAAMLLLLRWDFPEVRNGRSDMRSVSRSIRHTALFRSAVQIQPHGRKTHATCGVAWKQYPAP